MPPVRLRQVTRSKPGVADHAGECFLRREAADALDEIVVGLGRAGRERAEARNHLEGMEVVEPVEQRHLALREFEAEEVAADLQDAEGLRSSALSICVTLRMPKAIVRRRSERSGKGSASALP